MRDFNERDARGRSLLYVAARAADPAAVKRALILVNAETASARTVSGKTALFAAARGGCREIVEILAKRADADPNARTRDGRTALWTACYHGHVEAAAALVANGADPSVPDASGRTPLLAACATGSGTCARFLLSGACDMPRRVDAEAREASAGCSPLFAACVDGDASTVTSLLCAGAKVDAENKHGRTPLMAAAMCAHADVVLALMCRGADPNRADEGGETALHLAAANIYAGDDDARGPGCRQIVEMLAKRADADARDERGFTPLLTACWHGNAAAVETLIRTIAPRRLNLDASTDAGRSPLHAACWRGGFSCAAALLDAGADLDARDDDGRAALWAAARAGDEQCVRLCLERGADASGRDEFGRTALHAAAFADDYPCVAALLAHGADARACDRDGNVPIDVLMDADDAMDDERFLKSPVVAALREPLDGVVAARAAHESRLNRVAHDALVASRRAAAAAKDDGTLDGTLDARAVARVGALMDEAAGAWTEARDAARSRRLATGARGRRRTRAPGSKDPPSENAVRALAAVADAAREACVDAIEEAFGVESPKTGSAPASGRASRASVSERLEVVSRRASACAGAMDVEE